ncbi:hypothetical protein JCM10908_006432 [Rhodotorula pacifica]|uniref:uncharacterized protein n=1 Tax=Rhodotorula pacifica TaxID=1495444 RepID=UPI00317190BB
METGKRPRKRVKPAADPAAEFYGRLVASCTRLQQLAPDGRTAPNALQDELAVTADRLTRLESALGAIDASARDPLPDGWRDQLDAIGTSLWNQSTSYRHTISQVDQKDRSAARNAVACMRQIAFDLLRLGNDTRDDAEASLERLSLATKTACAFLDADQPARAESLIIQSGDIAIALAQANPAASEEFARKRTKALLAHYCCRIRVAIVRGTVPVAGWLRDRARALLERGEVSWREVELLARTAYDAGHLLAQDQKDGALDSQNAHNQAIDWLRFSLSLLEGGQPEWTTPLQIAVLKALAQVYLKASPARSRWEQAAETLRMVLDLEPEDDACARRLMKLVIARGGSDADIEEGRHGAANRSDAATDVYRTVAALELLPASRKNARLGIVLSVCQRLASSADLQLPASLSHLVSIAFLVAGEADHAQLDASLQQIHSAAPSTRVEEADAFAVATAIWRIAEKAEKEGRPAVAASWYLLGVGPLFTSMPNGLRAKLARRAVLAKVQAGHADAAQMILTSDALQTDEAKNHFVRFYASASDAHRALDAIRNLVRAPDVTPNLLLWAHKVALERGQQDLASQILRAVASAFQDSSGQGASAVGLDLFVLTRSIIRALINDFKLGPSLEQRAALLSDIVEQFTSALAAIRAREEAKGSRSEELSKELAWLLKTAYNLCGEYQHEWTADVRSQMFRLAIDMMTFSLQTSTSADVEILSKLAACKLAVLSCETDQARATSIEDEQADKYGSIASEARALLELLAQPSAARIDNLAEKRAAALAVLAEAFSKLGRWDELLKLAQPLSALKLLVALAIDPQSSCPHDVLTKLLRKALDILYSRRDIDQLGMASWLRAIVLALLYRRELDEALKYVENAAHFIGQPQSTYPAEEADWMAATAWDEGVDLFAASSPRAGCAWCQVAIKITKATNDLLAKQWQQELDQLESRFGGADKTVEESEAA